jgi:hypothetical protein
MGGTDAGVRGSRCGTATLTRRQPRHSRTAPYVSAWLRGENGWRSRQEQYWQDIGLPNPQVFAVRVIPELRLLDAPA